MALTQCKECKKEVSTSAKTCPNCGAKGPASGQAFRVFSLAVFAVFAMGVFASLLPGGDPLRKTVSAAEYGDRWPLKVDSAVIGCKLPSVRYLEVDGVRYALNGKALTAGMPRADQIRRDPDDYSLADFTERAGELCGK